MLNYTLSESSSVDIATEIEYTTNYLEVMKLRYGENLSYQISIPETMKKIQIPKLLIQPLVENAVQHGLAQDPPGT
ncbi:MAG: histidine kinase [Candidatus Caldatribacteriaceae bacterium]